MTAWTGESNKGGEERRDLRDMCEVKLLLLDTVNDGEWVKVRS